MVLLRWRGAAVVLLWFVMSTRACPQPETIKPCVCTTRADEIQIWCSHSELSSVLNGLKSVGSQLMKPIDELILENNAMTALPGQAFAPLRVVRIMLRDNKLERVAANWLGGLEETLLEVFVVEPELKSLPEESFETLVKLEAVTLKAGFLSRMPDFSNLARLRYVHTELPSLTDLTPGKINNLETLETLNIVESPLMHRLEASSLQDLPRLLLANFSGCGISWIHPRAMSRLPSIKELIFTGNEIKDAGEVGRSVRELPLLTTLRLDNNRIEILGETSFVDIPPLEELYINNNRIREVQRGAFHRLPSLKKVDLSDNQISRVLPEFFLQSYDSNVEELNLMNNHIDHIMALTIILDTLPAIKFLDVSHNHISDIMFGALRGHPTLERLHLNGNGLKRIVREAFSGFPSLIELRLKNNSLSNYLEMPLWNLPALKGLDLGSNDFRRLDRRVLANLPSLRRLDMSRNNLLVVDPASFLGTPSLEHVNISHNAIDNINPQTFPHLSNLYEIDVGSNRLRSLVPGLPRAVEYLYMSRNQLSSFPRGGSPDSLLPALKLLDLNGNRLATVQPEGFISMPLLRKLFIGENSVQRIEERCFEGLGRLETLDLHDNKINYIHDHAFRDLRRLQELILKNNRLELIQEGLLRENSALKSLDVSHNLISLLPENVLNNNRQLRDLSLSHNALGEFPNAVMNLPALESLDVSHNRINQLIKPLNELKELTSLDLSVNKITTLIDGTFANMESLEQLDLEGNEIQYVSPHVVKGMPSLHTLKLSKNKLSTIPSAAFSDLPSLTEVELQENQLIQLASDAFTGVPNLLMLNLSHNLLTGLERAGLQGIKSMEILDVSHNKIARLSSPNLPHMDSLIQLKMDHNRICQIQGSPFSKMAHLRMLSLKNNRLVSLSEHSFQPLRSSIYQLDIEGNPLKCTCGLSWLQNWIREGPHFGPRCSDGTIERDIRHQNVDCLEPKNELLYSCEDGPTVTGHNLQHGGNSNSWKDPNVKPLPEESDYFYEDYIEYDDNTTKIITSHHNTNNLVNQMHQQLASSTSPPVAVSNTNPLPPAVMSHYVPGDTPTIYAKPTASAIGVQPTTKPQSQYTFFGMPLPSLNLGNFWGSSRNNDGTSRFPGAKAKVQSVTTTLKPEEGFLPILQGDRGGFKPIFNPYNKTEDNYERIQSITPRPELQGNGLLNLNASSPSWEVRPNLATISKVNPPRKDQVIPNTAPQETNHFFNRDHKSSSSSQATTWAPPTSSSAPPWTSSQQTIFPYNRLEPESANPSTPQLETVGFDSTEAPTIPPYPSSTVVYSASQSSRSKYHSTQLTDTFSYDSTSVNDGNNPPVVTSNNSSSSSLQIKNLSVGGNGPSPLSGFLAPGGQLPPRTHGRPTITKVTMAPTTTLSSPGALPVAEEILGPVPSNRESKSNRPPDSAKQESKDWYFQNYNNTNLSPYVGPGMNSNNKNSATKINFSLTAHCLASIGILLIW